MVADRTAEPVVVVLPALGLTLASVVPLRPAAAGA